MTREEAIEILKNPNVMYQGTDGVVGYTFNPSRGNYEAFQLAIKALEQQPCEDIMTIHTQGLDEGIRCAMCTNSMKSDRGCDGGCVVNEAMYKEVMNTIRNHINAEQLIHLLPSVKLQEPKWIPVSERLPEEMGTYMTTIDYGEHGLVTGQRYYYGRGLKWNDECVIAWMPLPEPYREERTEE